MQSFERFKNGGRVSRVDTYSIIPYGHDPLTVAVVRTDFEPRRFCRLSVPNGVANQILEYLNELRLVRRHGGQQAIFHRSSGILNEYLQI
jgi:hypothetical protein